MQAGYALFITCIVWWIYFDDIANSHLTNNRLSFPVWLLGHLPLQFSIMMLGIGIKKTLAFNFNSPLELKSRMLLLGTMSLILISCAMIDAVTQRKHSKLKDSFRTKTRLISGVLLFLVMITSDKLSNLWILTIALCILVFQIMLDVLFAPSDIHSEAELRLGKDEDKNKAVTRVKHSSQSVLKPIQKGVPNDFKNDLYYSFMEASWTQVFVVFFLFYLISNVFFASLYISTGDPIAHSNGGFWDAFFFSVQTMSTIGYGVLAPQHFSTNILVTIEAAYGLLTVAVMTGLIFSKLSSPTAQVLFSQNLLDTSVNSERVLTFRMGNARGNDLIEAKVTLTALIDQVTEEGETYRQIVDLPLKRAESPFFRMTWSVFHVLNESSAFLLNGKQNPNIRAILVTVTGHDGTYSSTVYARHIYSLDDVLNNAHFDDILEDQGDGHIVVDFERFHSVKKS